MNTDALSPLLSLAAFPPIEVEHHDGFPGQRAAESAALAAYRDALAAGDPSPMAHGEALRAYLTQAQLAQVALLPDPVPAVHRRVSGAMVREMSSGSAHILPDETRADAGVVSADGAARAAADRKALLDDAGLALPPPVYAIGSRVNGTGSARARWFREQFDALPTTSDACAALAQTVAGEKREDVPVELPQLHAEDDGALEGPDGARWYAEPEALESLVRRAGFGDAARFLGRAAPDLRATNLNRMLAGTATPDPVGEPVEAVLRTRRSGGARAIFAVVSPSYTRLDADEIAAVVAGGVPAGTRAEVAYDGTRTRIEVLAHSTVQPADYVAGEVFRVGVVVRSSDDGSAAVKVYPVAWSNLCLNLYILGAGAGVVTTLRHVGDRARIVAQFRDAFVQGLSRIEHFLAAWNVATRDELDAIARAAGASADVSEQAAGFFRAALPRLRSLGASTRSAEGLVTDLVTMHGLDASSATKRAPLTRASLVAAFTRFAHQLRDPFEADAITTDASELLYDDRPLTWAPAPTKAAKAPKTHRIERGCP
jgi:hypothetical protein